MEDDSLDETTRNFLMGKKINFSDHFRIVAESKNHLSVSAKILRMCKAFISPLNP